MNTTIVNFIKRITSLVNNVDGKKTPSTPNQPKVEPEKTEKP
jgi:hypothetical protein